MGSSVDPCSHTSVGGQLADCWYRMVSAGMALGTWISHSFLSSFSMQAWAVLTLIAEQEEQKDKLNHSRAFQWMLLSDLLTSIGQTTRLNHMAGLNHITWPPIWVGGPCVVNGFMCYSDSPGMKDKISQLMWVLLEGIPQILAQFGNCLDWRKPPHQRSCFLPGAALFSDWLTREC